jgi:glyoxylase-like metal-dependent hydrolase (beta-lactamase superfamily II)/rhodanese-related sulfurtransferase
MIIEQIYTGCLSHAAYYIESNGEAAVIDPLREFQPYVNRAKSNNAQIKYVFETHFHADFVSGHIDLAKETGAKIIYGPTVMKTGFEITVATDNQDFKIGGITIRLLHTPGHTMESSCYLLLDENGKEKAIFTGDTLFIGDVGRPDLAQHVIADLTEEKLARLLYHSLRNKIMPLSDEIIVYPGHGAGSACGKNLSKETTDTLGHQKQTNYALNPDLSEEDFIKEVLTGLMPPPAYFPKNVLLNINGYDSIKNVMERGATEYSSREFEAIKEDTDALILDIRNPAEFIKGHIPNSISIGIEGSFAVWAGTIIQDIKQPILIVDDQHHEQEAIARLARVGYDNVVGFLKDGITGWKNTGHEIGTLNSISANNFIQKYLDDPTINIIDVRKKSEYLSEHIEGAINIPLDYINSNQFVLDKTKTYYVHCAGGYRSVIFISILKSRGFTKLINIEGGFAELKKLNKLNITDYICPTTML